MMVIINYNSKSEVQSEEISEDLAEIEPTLEDSDSEF